MTGVRRALLILALLLLTLRFFIYPLIPVYAIVLSVLLFILASLSQPPDGVETFWHERVISCTRGEEVELALDVAVREGFGAFSVSIIVPEEMEIVEGKSRTDFIKPPWPRKVRIKLKLRPRRIGSYKIQSPEFRSIGMLASGWRTFNVGEPAILEVTPEGGEVLRKLIELRSNLIRIPLSPGAMTGPLSMDFKEIRDYRSDPINLINWKASARIGRILVNEYEREGGNVALIYYDNRRACMEETAFLTSVLAELLSGIGYSVEIYRVSDRRVILPSRSPRLTYHRLLGEVQEDGSLVEALKRTGKKLRLRPRVIIITRTDEEAIGELITFTERIRYLTGKAPVVVDACFGEIELLKAASRDTELKAPVRLWNVFRESPFRVATSILLRMGRMEP